MSSTKDHIFEIEQKAFLEWVGDRLDHDALDEESQAYQALAQEHSDMIDAYDQEAEYRWLERQSFHEQYIEFGSELRGASMMLRHSEHGPHVHMTCKLVYAHAVTLLETMISTSVRALVLRDKAFLLNIAKQIETIHRGKKFTLLEIAEHPKGVEGVILKSLSDLTFHNPATIKSVLCVLIGDRMKDLDVSSIAPICKMRHDIVHRNGRTIDDEIITLEPCDVFRAMDTVDAFASDVSRRIRETLNEMDIDF